MPYPSIDERLTRVIAHLAEVGDHFFASTLCPQLQERLGASSSRVDDLREAMLQPLESLNLFLSLYAFSRRGRERQDLSQCASLALRRLTKRDAFEQDVQSLPVTALWECFEVVCAERNRKPGPEVNRGPIEGIWELVQEIHDLDGTGSIPGWVLDGLARTGRLEAQFLRIVDIRGIGPKTTSTFLRDLVRLFEVEDGIENIDRLYLQPVDKWLREFAVLAFPEIGDDAPADWVVAGKTSKYCRLAGVSGVRFSMGLTAFGSQHVHHVERLGDALRRLGMPLIKEA